MNHSLAKSSNNVLLLILQTHTAIISKHKVNHQYCIQESIRKLHKIISNLLYRIFKLIYPGTPIRIYTSNSRVKDSQGTNIISFGHMNTYMANDLCKTWLRISHRLKRNQRFRERAMNRCYRKGSTKLIMRQKIAGMRQIQNVNRCCIRAKLINVSWNFFEIISNVSGYRAQDLEITRPKTS